MKKILVNISVPAVNEAYDVFVPVDLKIESLVKAIAQNVRTLSNNRYEISGMEKLMLKSPLMIFDSKLMLKDYGILDSDNLVMI